MLPIRKLFFEYSLTTLVSQYLHWVTAILVHCQHKNLRPSEGKCFCKDCGKGLVFSWVILRCDHCQSRLPLKLQFKQLCPKDNFCMHCGHQEASIIALESAKFYQLDQAILVCLEELYCFNTHPIKLQVHVSCQPQASQTAQTPSIQGLTHYKHFPKRQPAEQTPEKAMRLIPRKIKP